MPVKTIRVVRSKRLPYFKSIQTGENDAPYDGESKRKNPPYALCRKWDVQSFVNPMHPGDPAA